MSTICKSRYKKTSENIWEAPEVWNEHSVPPFRLRETIPEEKLTFNIQIATSIMLLSGEPVLHIVDVDKNFKNAIVTDHSRIRNFFQLLKKSWESWNDFIDFWASAYIVLPDLRRLDRQTSFKFEEFRKCERNGNLPTIQRDRSSQFNWKMWNISLYF